MTTITTFKVGTRIQFTSSKITGLYGLKGTIILPSQGPESVMYSVQMDSGDYLPSVHPAWFRVIL